MLMSRSIRCCVSAGQVDSLRSVARMLRAEGGACIRPLLPPIEHEEVMHPTEGPLEGSVLVLLTYLPQLIEPLFKPLSIQNKIACVNSIPRQHLVLLHQVLDDLRKGKVLALRVRTVGPLLDAQPSAGRLHGRGGNPEPPSCFFEREAEVLPESTLSQDDGLTIPAVLTSLTTREDGVDDIRACILRRRRHGGLGSWRLLAIRGLLVVFRGLRVESTMRSAEFAQLGGCAGLNKR
mmetsp:Transcript_41815/g.131873  ORF Transcript_41815/g.131873 Transcript_41815/m.131873 type:complete len:235 (-) Transcript_41815:307-1011(-)